MKPDLSVVIPIYNEEDNLQPLYEELGGVLDEMERPYEVLLIDDGSRDASYARMQDIHGRDSRWGIVRFRRNFGQTAAMQAGFNLAQGEWVITLDADLQNDPRDIPKLLAKAESGYDIVSGWRKDRKEPFLSRRLPSMLANGLISQTTGVTLHDYGCSLKVYHREVVKNVHLYGELHRFIPAIASWMGVTVTEMPVNDRARRFGKSKYGIGRTFRVVLDLITVLFYLRYFQRPLHVFGGLGLLTSVTGIGIGIYLSFSKLVFGEQLADRPLLLLAVLLTILGVQLLSIGLVAEMMTRTYYESQGITAYSIREQHTPTQQAHPEEVLAETVV